MPAPAHAPPDTLAHFLPLPFMPATQAFRGGGPEKCRLSWADAPVGGWHVECGITVATALIPWLAVGLHKLGCVMAALHTLSPLKL